MKGPKKDGRLGNLWKASSKTLRGEEMRNQATLRHEDIAGVLYFALELSKKTWKLAFLDGIAPQERQVSIPAGDLERLKQEIGKAKRRFGLEETAKVESCYEAGREGFWLHRELERMGIENLVVDPASVGVDRRQRRAKTDRLDAGKLVRDRVRYARGEHDVWRVVRVPSEEAEDQRQVHRGLEVLKEERKQHRVRIQSLLYTQGIDVKVGGKFLSKLEQLRRRNQEPIPPQLKQRIQEEYHRLQLVEVQIRELQARQKAQLRAAKTSAAIEKIKLLNALVGIGLHSSWTLVMEFLGWRVFQNRRQVGAAVGITGTPYNSGDSVRDQGISRAGNWRIRKLIIELAWAWLRFQPQSKLAQWYNQRFAKGGKRMRRIGIVALARRLMIDLWRWVEFGTVPEGARLRTSASSQA
jgi:transposase